MDLKEAFYSVTKKWVKDDAVLWSRWKELLDNYTESFRKYHNLNHIRELLYYFETYKSQLKYPDEVAYSIFYHDLIYNVWSKNNEQKSAELAVDYLSDTDADYACLIRVFNLILATKDHDCMENEDEKWMVDFDLAILGQPWEEYTIYTQKIREEYIAVPSFIYKKGRKKVLRYFLNKNRIYKTDEFYKLFEINARNNIKKELESL